MSAEPGSDLKFEIGHVLFIDIVGYSKLLINDQSERIQQLREIVRATEQFRSADAQGKLMRLPTGDGGALVFRTSAEAPVLCALEISRALKAHPELRVRMGIHSGPVNEVADLNEQVNMAGAGINVAQRVMDCADAGHILLSKRAELPHIGRGHLLRVIPRAVQKLLSSPGSRQTCSGKSSMNCLPDSSIQAGSSRGNGSACCP